MRRAIPVLSLTMLLAACTRVDETEHCIETRYGNVISEHMAPGLNGTVFTDAECFSLIDQNFPEDGQVETIEAQTADPVTVSGDMAITFAFDPNTVYQLFLDKRTQRAAIIEIQNATREGYRTALASWTVAEIFSNRRAEFGDSVKAHIQRKLGSRAIIKQVFARDIRIPQVIETARIEAAKQAQVLAQARDQARIDSVNAQARLSVARADAEAKRLTATAYEANPQLLQLEIAREMSKMCQGVTTCVLGGSVADTWRMPGGGR